MRFTPADRESFGRQNPGPSALKIGKAEGRGRFVANSTNSENRMVTVKYCGIMTDR
jgi:hypothetical protein